MASGVVNFFVPKAFQKSSHEEEKAKQQQAPSRKVTVAATQMACPTEVEEENHARAEQLVRAAAAAGADVVLLQELFSGPYFCIDMHQKYFAKAKPVKGHPLLARMSALAKELNVVIPVSFFEASGNVFFNSLCMIDSDGTQLGVYRKSHIPDGNGYAEKFYFSPGDTGFKVWETKKCRIGSGICWDQWFPECARAMSLEGAEILLYPTAIGSEPQDADLDTRDHWRRTMQGHAAANYRPVISSNRIGTEESIMMEKWGITFYGSSFITDETGGLVKEMDRKSEGFITHTFDLDEIAAKRSAWGFFRDRRPDLYSSLCSHGGQWGGSSMYPQPVASSAIPAAQSLGPNPQALSSAHSCTNNAIAGNTVTPQVLSSANNLTHYSSADTHPSFIEARQSFDHTSTNPFS